MIRIGITGQNGFIGTHLWNNLGLFPDEFECIKFDRSYFNDEKQLDQFVQRCDVIVHLAAINRHDDQQYIYDTNIEIAKRLVDSLERSKVKPLLIISSSTQEQQDNLYGLSKKLARQAISTWGKNVGAKVTGLIIPNVFGAFGKPFYNSFISTFCHQLTHGEVPTIIKDSEVKLIYVQELVSLIITQIKTSNFEETIMVEPTTIIKVSEVLGILKIYKSEYLEKGEIPILDTKFKLDLFNTYRSYIDCEAYFPVNLVQHNDHRGSFVELIRLGIGGQLSFSTSKTGVVRGNHFHTRKIERFAVIKGKAQIQLRRIGSNEVLNFYLDGDQPAYVDMPIWYTHNIINIGEGDLYTNFWINETYNPADADTYFETV
jgi:UDP-2-acetamido-2,6-beta-L-arabino-hexul-4-ose reductase